MIFSLSCDARCSTLEFSWVPGCSGAGVGARTCLPCGWDARLPVVLGLLPGVSDLTRVLKVHCLSGWTPSGWQRRKED